MLRIAPIEGIHCDTEIVNETELNILKKKIIKKKSYDVEYETAVILPLNTCANEIITPNLIPFLVCKSEIDSLKVFCGGKDVTKLLYFFKASSSLTLCNE